MQKKYFFKVIFIFLRIKTDFLYTVQSSVVWWKLFKYSQKLPLKNIFFLHISSSYAKILRETNFHSWEIPRSGSKAEDGEERKRERAKVGNNRPATHCNATSRGARKAAWAKRKRDWTMVITMAKLRMAHESTHGARKPPGPIFRSQIPLCLFLHKYDICHPTHESLLHFVYKMNKLRCRGNRINCILFLLSTQNSFSWQEGHILTSD